MAAVSWLITFILAFASVSWARVPTAQQCDAAGDKGAAFSPLVTVNSNLAKVKMLDDEYEKYLNYVEQGRDFAAYSSPVFKPAIEFMLQSYETGAVKGAYENGIRLNYKEELKEAKGEARKHILEKLKELDVEREQQHARLKKWARQDKVSMRVAQQEAYTFLGDEFYNPPNNFDGYTRWSVRYGGRPGSFYYPDPTDATEEDFINLSTKPIFILGLINTRKDADGDSYTPQGFWSHDDDHTASMQDYWFDFEKYAKVHGQKKLAEAIREEIADRQRCGCHLMSSLGADADPALRFVWYFVQHEMRYDHPTGTPTPFADKLKDSLARAPALLQSQEGLVTKGDFGKNPVTLLPPEQRRIVIFNAVNRMMMQLQQLDGNCRSKEAEEAERQAVKSRLAAAAENKKYFAQRCTLAQPYGPYGTYEFGQRLGQHVVLDIRENLAAKFKALSPEQQEEALQEAHTRIEAERSLQGGAARALASGAAGTFTKNVGKFISKRILGPVSTAMEIPMGSLTWAPAMAHETPQYYQTVEGAKYFFESDPPVAEMITKYRDASGITVGDLYLSLAEVLRSK